MGVTINKAAAPRFDGDFDIAPDASATEPQKAYVANVNAVLTYLFDDNEADKVATLPEGRLAARQERRRIAATRLFDDSKKNLNDPAVLATLSTNAFEIKGAYIAERKRLDRKLFEIEIKPADTKHPEDVDIFIKMTPDLPPPDNVPTAAKQDLYVQIHNTSTVIRTVCKQLRDADPSSDGQTAANRLLENYMRKLEGLAKLGLQGPFTSLATVGLTELRNEFVAEHAGRIKNAYVRKLGYVAAAAAAALLVGYVLILIRHYAVEPPRTPDWWYSHSKFLLAAAGAAAGAWSSFLIRRVQLTFADLAAVEEDLLDPAARIIFVVGLSVAACLLFWTGVMNIEIGSLKTNATEFERNGSIALLIGIFCGLSERALATAISGRAAAFVRGIGGSA